MTDKEIEEAIKRIAQTRDGRVLHLYLQRVLFSFAPATKSGALQRHEGRRSLAHELKGLMDQALAETADSDRAGTSIVVVTRQPVDTGGRRGAGRRVTGYPEPADAAGKSA